MTQSKPQQPSWRHHYMPEFYLKRWGHDDGRLTEFALTSRGLRARRTHPRGTGWSEGLYSVPLAGLEDALERRFFQELDGRADRVLAHLLDAQGRTLSPAEFSSISRFVMSLLLRDPEGVASTRAKIEQGYPHALRSFQERYAEVRAPGDPDDIVNYFRDRDPQFTSELFLRIMRSTIDNPRMGGRLNWMSWHLLSAGGSPTKFLTSDRPVLVSLFGIGDRQSYVALPLSPTTALIGVNDVELIRNIESHPIADTVRDLNGEVVSQAKLYVYGSDEKEKAFIEEHFGKATEPTIQEMLRTSPLPFAS